MVTNLKYLFMLLGFFAGIFLLLGLPLAAASHLILGEYDSFSPLHHPWCFAFVASFVLLYFFSNIDTK